MTLTLALTLRLSLALTPALTLTLTLALTLTRYVDALFGFSFPLGLDYMGEWEDDSTFLVTIINTISAPMERPYRVDIQDVIACAGQPPETCEVTQIPMEHQLDVLAPFLPAAAAATLQAPNPDPPISTLALRP